MTITLIISIPITALVVGFLMLKSVQLGLRWQVQASKQEQPTMEIPNPIQPIVEARQEKVFQKQEEVQRSILHEYLNGVEE
ncbi:hypothetical protein [Bacillus sp. FJAT-49736]|uniref:hypothetical protein n=1 Tax=Bacillus sp. FJAT-49736 TaxID=2833582 RepID=UPI001BC95BAB|nr:hypothetical protein [Bacillus sp. FJAT-49736]MBS4173477.1 hypothetical protein [Bacillus sp. FJAT-49736]